MKTTGANVVAVAPLAVAPLAVAPLAVAVLAVAAMACAGAPLGGGTGGRGAGGSTGLGGGGAPCTGYYYDCTRGVGGNVGTGGIPGSGGNTVLCGQLAQKYSAEVSAAAACTPGAPNQCQALVATFATTCPGSVCGAEEYVNDATTLEAIREEWLSACSAVDETCIEPACGVQASVCLPTSPGATAGTCVPLGSDAGAGVVPDGGESCDQLSADYSAAVTAALACTPGAPNQCQTYVTTTPSGCDPNCGVSVFVNDASKASTALQRWINQCVGTVFCPLIYCDPPVPAQGTCVSGGTTTGGTCVSGAPL